MHRRIRAGDLENVVAVLLRAFQTSLLQTYKSKFTQARGTQNLPCALQALTVTLPAVSDIPRVRSRRVSASLCRVLQRHGAAQAVRQSQVPLVRLLLTACAC
jgi:hypothetical protein